MSALDDDQRYMLRNISTSTNHLLYLVNDILDFSKMEAGQLQLHPHHCRLTSVICDVIRGHAALAYGKGLNVTLRWGKTVPDLACIDGIRVGQVISNLLNNAVKFTEAGAGLRPAADRLPHAGDGWLCPHASLAGCRGQSSYYRGDGRYL
ncbi:sensor histidine kinase [Aeromonas caviae]